VTVPFVDLGAARRELGGALEEAVGRVAASDRYLLGPELDSFEREFAEYCGTRHCVGVGSGLSAIELALRAAGVGPGDEVIVPAYTWIATWLAVSRVGAVPVGVDVLESSYNIDPRLISDAIGPRTAAIIPVHLRGEPADLDAIGELAASHDLLVVEDAAQAHGARHRGRSVGGLGSAAAFSFYPSKNLGAVGDGGAVTTDDDEIAERVRVLRNYGMRNRYEIAAAGVNSRLAEIQAAVLRVKLRHLDGWNRARAALAAAYAESFSGDDLVSMPRAPTWAEPVWHLYMVNLADRDLCSTSLDRQGIQTLVHYPVLPHKSPPYAETASRELDFPVAERLAATSLSLPMYPQLDPAEPGRIADAVAQAAAAARNSS
jgi:dTDP-3-amino-3,6-dideoxy-alpha-D-glucopyranose transaminase